MSNQNEKQQNTPEVVQPHLLSGDDAELFQRQVAEVEKMARRMCDLLVTLNSLGPSAEGVRLMYKSLTNTCREIYTVGLICEEEWSANGVLAEI